MGIKTKKKVGLERDSLRIVKVGNGKYEVLGEGITLEQRSGAKPHDVHGEWEAIKSGVIILKATGLANLVNLLVDDPAEPEAAQEESNQEDKDYLDGM
jgi:hypothetical protein